MKNLNIQKIILYFVFGITCLGLYTLYVGMDLEKIFCFCYGFLFVSLILFSLGEWNLYD